MIEPSDLHQTLSEKMPGAEITVQDLTGTQDHYQAIVVWSKFRGKSLVEQHQMVNRASETVMADGRLHALKIKTLTPIDNI